MAFLPFFNKNSNAAKILTW